MLLLARRLCDVLGLVSLAFPRRHEVSGGGHAVHRMHHARFELRFNGDRELWRWHAGTIRARWRRPRPARRVRYNEGRAAHLEALESGTPAWWTALATVEAPLKEGFTVRFGLHNVADRHYKVFASGLSAAGRELRFTLRWSPA